MPAEATSTRTRRALLAGAAGAVGVWAAGLVGRVTPVSAANGGSTILGSSNSATLTTSVTTTSGSGLQGTGPIGVSGTSTGTGTTNAGVYGTAASTANYGVYSSGKLGVVGPVELATITISNWAGPASGKAYLYAKAGTSTTELHVRFPSGVDKLLASG